jgi:hypothetical protein
MITEKNHKLLTSQLFVTDCTNKGLASMLSLDEGLNSPCDKNASTALWKREPISNDYLPSMRKAVLSISGNVYKQQEMEIDKLINDV